jgi:Phage integrase family
MLQQPADKCRNRECGASIRGLKSPLAGLRFHDLRHQAITELAESGASDQTIMSIAGHVSQKMLSHYSHVRLEAKRSAVQVLGSRLGPRGYDTLNDTNGSAQATRSPEVVEKSGGREGIRTPGLLVANEALSQLSYSPTSSN